MMTSPNGNIFRVTGPLWGKSTGHRWIPSHRPVTRSFDVFFDLRYNKRLSKQSRRRWFETPSRSLWRHYNDMRQWTGSSVVQITACHLFGAKPCLNQWRPVVSWTLRNTLQRNPSQNEKKNLFFEDHAFESVVKKPMAICPGLEMLTKQSLKIGHLILYTRVYTTANWLCKVKYNLFGKHHHKLHFFYCLLKSSSPCDRGFVSVWVNSYGTHFSGNEVHRVWFKYL